MSDTRLKVYLAIVAILPAIIFEIATSVAREVYHLKTRDWQELLFAIVLYIVIGAIGCLIVYRLRRKAGLV